jgi:hypothetical protein
MHAAQEEEEGEQGTKDHSHSSSPAPDGVDEDNKKSTQREREKREGRRERTRRDGRGAYKWAVLKPREKALLLPQLQPKLTCLLSHFTPPLLLSSV